MRTIGQMYDGKFFFINEVGFNVSMRTRSGRSIRGTTPIHTVAYIRSRNISVCCAMSKSGILKYQAETRAYNTLKFKDYITNFIEYLSGLGINNGILIMDNVAFHKVEEI
ncbi:hypothetical protein ENBRE01_2160 [Enteropsectra breve]|nr:hypothetical protein ENBRE01_2160 [Enteropsectra breve]